MFKVLFKVLLSIIIFIIWILALVWQSIWSNNFRNTTGMFISDFLVLWNMDTGDLYSIERVK